MGDEDFGQVWLDAEGEARIMAQNSWDFITDFFSIPVKWAAEKAIDAGTRYVGDQVVNSYFSSERISGLRARVTRIDWITHILSLAIAASAEYYIEGK